MKKNEKKLFIFIIILATILLINLFILNFLSGFKIIVFEIITLVLLNKNFSLKKIKTKHKEKFTIKIMLFFLFYFTIYYLLSTKIGFYKNIYYSNISGLLSKTVFLIIYIILRELLRHNLINMTYKSKIKHLIVPLLVLFDITNITNEDNFLTFTSLYLLPSVSKNIVYSYLTKEYGISINIIFDLIISLYPSLFPILPNPNEYSLALINFLTPILFLQFININLKQNQNVLIRKNKTFKYISGLLIVVMIYLCCGYFKYKVVVVTTNSMSPRFNRGDIIIINQKPSNKNLNVGDIIVYRKYNDLVIHRIIKKIKINKKYYYYTKGDSNNAIDNIITKKDNIIGKTNITIPFLGVPGLILNKK